MVTGTAAVVASVTPLRGSALRGQITGTADDLGAHGYDTQFGAGRVNTYRAVTGKTLDEGGGNTGGTTLAASFTYNCSGTTCDFDGSGSTGAITTYAWTFGDGGTGSGVNSTHTYAGNGSYAAVLTVSDGTGTDQASHSITCKKRGRNGVVCN